MNSANIKVLERAKEIAWQSTDMAEQIKNRATEVNDILELVYDYIEDKKLLACSTTAYLSKDNEDAVKRRTISLTYSKRFGPSF
jgi:transcription initiation factor IIE alpha subunit